MKTTNTVLCYYFKPLVRKLLNLIVAMTFNIDKNEKNM